MLRLVKTCECCPEQYDVYATNKMVGYIRCRWGEVEVYGIPENGEFKDWELIYLSLTEGYGAFGEEERERHLRAIKKSFHLWLKSKEEK